MSTMSDALAVFNDLWEHKHNCDTCRPLDVTSPAVARCMEGTG